MGASKASLINPLPSFLSPYLHTSTSPRFPLQETLSFSSLHLLPDGKDDEDFEVSRQKRRRRNTTKNDTLSRRSEEETQKLVISVCISHARRLAAQGEVSLMSDTR